MIEQMCKDFLKTEVHPYLDKIDSMTDPEMMPKLIRMVFVCLVCALTCS